MVKKYSGYTLFTGACRGRGMAHLLLVGDKGINIGVSKDGKADTVYPDVTSDMIIEFLDREDSTLVCDFIQKFGDSSQELICVLYSWSNFQRSFDKFKKQSEKST